MTDVLTATAGRRGLLLAALLGPVLAACSGGSGAAAPTAGGLTPAVSADPVVATSATGAAKTGGGGTPTGAPGGAGAASGTTQGADDGTGTSAAGGADPSGTATVGLVAGFPTTVIPVVPGATVTASAVRRKGDRLELSLSGRTTKSSQAAVIAFYDKTFRARGFTAAGGGATLAPGTGGRIYARGDEVVVVAASTAGGAVSFSVGGTVRP